MIVAYILFMVYNKLQDGDLMLIFKKDGKEYGAIMHYSYNPTTGRLLDGSKHLVFNIAKKLELLDEGY